MSAAGGPGNVGGMSAPAPPGPPRPEIAELTWIAAELARLEESRRRLVARRDFLLAELTRPRPADVPVASAGPPAPRSAARAGGGRRGGRELSRRAVARLLLTAGGALVVIAAAVFTVASWSSMGPAGRGAVLLAVTALALAAPWPLARRDLATTAEAAAAIGLALTVADAGLGWRLVSGAPGLGPGPASLACAALAAAWAAYGGWAPVRDPLLAATGLAQLPLPLVAAAAWQAGLAALAAVAVAQWAAARLARPRPGLSLAIETAGWAAAAAAAAPGLREPGHASVVLTVTGTLCLCVALRPGRRFLLWPGLAQAEAALCAWLVSAGVHAPEPYTVPAGAVLLAAGWRRSRRPPRLSSWACYGPGLALLLLPSLVAVWLLPGWARPLVLGLAAAGIALAGGRARLLAPLLLGGVAVVLDAGHELAPAVQQLAGMLPRWVPIAVIGLVLLAVGATYEARLRDLGRLRGALGRMR
jgi:hypothetical protein